MLRPRIIPCLLIKNGGLVKTAQFDSPKYVGDPLNAVRIFNEKEVDELIVIDVDATVLNREPNFELIRQLASECRMPLCYGGGVKTVEQVQKIIGLGVEKVAISSQAISDPSFLSAIANRVGSQSVVVVLDVRKSGAGYQVYTHNGKVPTGIDPILFTKKLESLGAGEIVINSIDLDGTMTGYDLSLAQQVREATNLPLTILGGAGTLDHLAKLIRALGPLGAAAGSLFVFKGKFRAVLINYPTPAEKLTILS